MSDSQQMNGYNYANNSPVSSSDPDGLRPIGPTNSTRGDETYTRTHHGSRWVNNGHGWYWKNVQQTKIKGYGTVTVTTYIGRGTRNHPAPSGSVTFAAIKPKPKEVTFHGWAMGSNPNYNPSVNDDWIQRPPLSKWQKIILGIAGVTGAGVAVAPVALALGPEIAAVCLANPAGCAETASELLTGGAAGGSMPSSGGVKALPAGAGKLPKVAKVYGPFHRIGSKTQTSNDLNKILESSELWGREARWGGNPMAQAHRGRLPTGAPAGSFEFYTTIAPKAQRNTPPGYAVWESGSEAGVTEFTMDGDDWAKIPIVITDVR